MISWQWRGNDLVVFVGQFPNLGDCIAKLRLDKKYDRFCIGYFYVYLGLFSSKNLPRAGTSTNNHCFVTNGDGAMILTSLCEIAEFSPLVIREFSNCWGVGWTLSAAYDICCLISSRSWVKVNFSKCNISNKSWVAIISVPLLNMTHAAPSFSFFPLWQQTQHHRERRSGCQV